MVQRRFVHELGLIWRLLDSVREGQFFLTMLRLQFDHTSPEVRSRTDVLYKDRHTCQKSKGNLRKVTPHAGEGRLPS